MFAFRFIRLLRSFLATTSKGGWNLHHHPIKYGMMYFLITPHKTYIFKINGVQSFFLNWLY